MSTIQHINSAIDHFWPQYQRKFPAFQHPEIVPAETLRGMAPIYMRRNIDQDPSSYYMFVKADPMKGDCSREAFKEIITDLFYNKLKMASSYEDNRVSPEEAVDKEILPAAKDTEFQRYYNEQLAAAEAKRAEEEKKARADKLDFDPDDPDIIDVDVDGNVVGSGASSSRAVDQAQTTSVAMPKQIWFAVDMHIQAGGMLGYNNGGRLNGRRHSGRYLHETEISSEESKIYAAYEWAMSKGLCNDLVTVAAALDGVCIDEYDLFVFKYADETYTWVQMNKTTKKYSATLKHMSSRTAMNFAKQHKVHKLIKLSVDEFTSQLKESRHAMKLKYDKMLRECYMKKNLFNKMLEEACNC